MTKHIINCILLAAAIFVFVYLLGSVYEASFDMAAWPEKTRRAVTITIGGGCFVLIGAYAEKYIF